MSHIPYNTYPNPPVSRRPQTRMNKLFLGTVALGLALVASTNAVEVRGGQPLTPEQIFSSIDKNHDGSINRTEMIDYFKKMGIAANNITPILNDSFLKNDLNKDGVISLEEWIKLHDEATPPTMRSGRAGFARPHGNVARMETLQVFAAGSGVTDEEHDSDDLVNDDGSFWLDFSEDDSIFCTPDKRAKDECWHRVYYNEEEDYHYACIEDPKDASSVVCYSIRAEE